MIVVYNILIPVGYRAILQIKQTKIFYLEGLIAHIVILKWVKLIVSSWMAHLNAFNAVWNRTAIRIARHQVLLWWPGVIVWRFQNKLSITTPDWTFVLEGVMRLPSPHMMWTSGSRRSITSAGCRRRRRAGLKDTVLVLLLPPDKLHPPSSEEHRFSTQDKLRGINTISWERRCTCIHSSLSASPTRSPFLLSVCWCYKALWCSCH